MHNTSTMHLIYQNPKGQEFSQHWRDLTEMGTLVDPETGDDLELVGWHSDTAAATEVEVQAAWHAGLDEGREQGKGNEHCRAEAQPVAWHTEDHLADKSATTYDPVVRDRWIAKGWPVTPLYAHPHPSAPVEVDAHMATLASLVAAVSLLRRGGRKAAPSDTMFNMMLSDYEKSIEASRDALAQQPEAVDARIRKVIDARASSLQAEVESLRDALDHIARVALGSKKASNRTLWIIERAKSALNRDDLWKQMKTPNGYHNALERR